MVKNLPDSVGDAGWIPGSGRSSGEGNGNPLQCCCLGNPMDRGAWCVTVRGVAQSWIQLSRHTHTHTHRVYGARKPCLADAALHTHS